jgi:signal recognition particle GTPase
MQVFLVVTDAFKALAVTQLRIHQADVPLVVIPHPLGGLRPSEVAARVTMAIDELKEIDERIFG